MISKEETIKEIEYLISDGVVLENIVVELPQKSIEALNMAITALKFNPQAAREAIDEIINTVHSQPERPKGRWECEWDAMMGETDVTCSHCKDTRTINGCYVGCNGESLYDEDNFCPNCGADMRDGEEE